MRDMALHAGGVIAVLAAIVHGVLGETKVFAGAAIDPPWVKLMLRLVWQCSAVAWAGLGVLVALAPWLGSASARHAIIAAAVCAFGFGAASNAWATGGRHFGWMVLLLASALAIAGW